MNDIKNLKKFEDDIEVLSIEDLYEKEPAPVKHRGKKKKRRKRKLPVWQKVLIGVVATLCVILVVGASTYFIFRSVGEKSLKAEASEKTILYNGKEYRYREDVINILCLGIDKPEAMEKKIDRRQILGMADAILLASIDTEKNALKIIAIPRDTMTNVIVTTDSGEVNHKEEMQLTYQYGYGKRAEQSGQLMVEAVSELLFDIPIEKFCAINFVALPVLNDAIGGVDLVVQEDMSSMEPAFVLNSQIHLEGELALKYVRLRNKTSVEGVTLRTQRQKQYAMEFLNKAKSVVANDLSLPVTVFQELQENMSTNVTIADITYLVPELLEMEVSDEVIQMLPGESVAGEDFLEYHTDKNAVKELVINTFYEEIEKDD